MLSFGVLALVALVAVLLLKTRIGIHISFQKSDVTAEIRAGFLRVRLFPFPEKPEEGAKAEKPVKEKKGGKAGGKKQPPPSFAQIRRALETVPPLIRAALKRILRGTRIDPLELYISFGGREDPARAAGQCGYALAAIWAIMPSLERALVIPEPFLNVEPDFDAAETSIDGEIGITISPGAAAAAALPLLAGLLRVWNGIQKENRKQENQGVEAEKRKQRARRKRPAA